MAALERGTRFLVAGQGGDGLWRDFHTPAGEASEWPTAVVGTALHQAGAAPESVERAADALVARQNDDGGWAYAEHVPTDADSTAWALLFLGLAGGRDEACGRAAACLVRHQRRGSGGVATYAEPGPIRDFMGVGRWMRFDGWCSPHLEVTATAGRALAALAPDAAAAAWRFTRARQRADGSWRPYWWTSPHYATQQAVELALAAGDREAAELAARWTLACQRDDGGWSTAGATTSAFATALSLSVLASAGAPTERAAVRLAGLQDDDGGWPSHPIMRIPFPGVVDPDRRHRLGRPALGMVVRDQHRLFTTAACVAALAAIDSTPSRD
jgi:squalene cyclase